MLPHCPLLLNAICKSIILVTMCKDGIVIYFYSNEITSSSLKKKKYKAQLVLNIREWVWCLPSIGVWPIYL